MVWKDTGDPLEALLARDWRESEYQWMAAPVRLGLWEATAQVCLPQGMREAMAGEPWEAKHLLKCVAVLGKAGQAEVLWGQLLQALAPALQDAELAPELTDAVVAEALDEISPMLPQVLERQPAVARAIFGQCVTASPLCRAILLDCLATGRQDQAGALLEEYRRGTSNPPRQPPGDLLRGLMEECGRRRVVDDDSARVLAHAIAALPKPEQPPLRSLHRRVFGTSSPEDRPLPPEPAPGQLRRSHPGREVMQVVIDRQMQVLCARRPRRQGALFLELVLLEPPVKAKTGEDLPLRNPQGEEIGRLALERLPQHPRTMVGRLLEGGQDLFACLDEQMTLASAGFFCVSLWWQR